MEEHELSLHIFIKLWCLLNKFIQLVPHFYVLTMKISNFPHKKFSWNNTRPQEVARNITPCLDNPTKNFELVILELVFKTFANLGLSPNRWLLCNILQNFGCFTFFYKSVKFYSLPPFSNTLHSNYLPPPWYESLLVIPQSILCCIIQYLRA